MAKKQKEKVAKKTTDNTTKVDINVKKEDDNRKYALLQSYLIGLVRYLDWITLVSKEKLEKLLSNTEANTLVTSYSIENEKFSEVRFVEELPEKFLEKNNQFLQDEKDDFDFNQDIDYESEIRSPGWLRYQKRIKS